MITSDINQGIMTALFGKTRRSILSLLFSRPGESFHLRNVLRLAGVSPGAGQRELARLSEAGIITRTAVDSQVRFQANSLCPVFVELKSLVAKTAGVAEMLRASLEPAAGSIERALVYGYADRGRVGKESDVELLIVGEVSYADVAGRLAEAQEILGREIDVTILSAGEYRRRLEEGDEFVRRAAAGPVVRVLPGR